VVVEDQPGALRGVERVAQLERQVRRCDRGLGEAAEHAHRRDLVALLQVAVVGRALDGARHLGARDEGEGRLELVLAAALEDLGERDPGGLDRDRYDAPVGGEHVLGLRLVEVDELEAGGAF
jgi:hypothetical protein